MKILFVHTRYLKSRGGEDMAVEAESKLLSSRGHEVEVLYFNNSVGNSLSAKAKVAVHAVYNSASAKRLREAINRFNPDIIHLHNFFFEASPSIIAEAARCKVPIVVTIHNYRLICTNALLLRNEKVCELCVQKTFPWYGVKYKCYHGSSLESAMVGAMSAIYKITGLWKSKVDCYITPSEFLRSKLVNSSLKLPASKIRVKRNFIEDPGCTGLTGRQDFFLFVGRLSGEKGIDLLLNAFAQLPGERLVIAGDGPDKEQLVHKYGHLQHVRFAGLMSKPEVLDLMRSCRGLIFPSVWYEGAPLTIIEAFATGTPIIASALGAMKEMIQHEVNGLWFEAANAGSLVKSIKKMNETVQSGGTAYYEAARKTYLEEYHPDACYASVMNIYQSVISEKSKHIDALR